MVFLVAFSESVAVVGLLVPGVVMMFGFGALVATGTLAFWPVFWWAVGGAIAGDGLSFWLGRHYKDRLHNLWPFSRHPETLQRGTEFFRKYGGKSVAIGRFFGPVRAIIPLVAGMLEMSAWRFFFANSLSALIWAPAYLLPGIVFGASLELAAEVAFRLVAVLLLGVGGIWLIFSVSRRLFRLIRPHATRIVQTITNWGARHPFLGEISSALGNPAHPEARGFGILATLLLLGTFLFGLLAAMVLEGTLISQPDHWVFNGLQSLRNPWSDNLMLHLSRFADLSTISVVTLAVGIFLIREHHLPALQHWLAAVLFGLLTPLLLKYSLQIPRPMEGIEGLGPWAFPSAHVLRATVTYGFLAILIARTLSLNLRWLPYSLASSIIAGVALSRLYLGAHWLSDVVASLLLGTAWIAALGMAWYRHAELERHWLGLTLSALLAAGFATALGSHLYQTEDFQRYRPAPPTQTISLQAWQQGAAASLPRHRHDIRERLDHPFNVQLAGPPQPLIDTLGSRGWQRAEMLGWHNLLRMLSPSLALRELPLLPQVHDGSYESITLVKHPDAGEQLVLRLWSTPVILRPLQQPVWIGNVSRQSQADLLGLLTYPITESDFQTPLEILKRDTADFIHIEKSDLNAPLFLGPVDAG
ncbi:MAG: phosphoesterase PA-phosphatase [endosymbiont of Escarpia spicata]|uniref:Phosphoesterase PA-phosphatase n=1 Tax=endosymbiont of Escarpia spicata TaxID=2200908 RepID=A0A370DKN4_9GAMM|nr:MAG: phosphoesterase PA-phosphatase [endosymbiont of Escarpia spicata]